MDSRWPHVPSSAWCCSHVVRSSRWWSCHTERQRAGGGAAWCSGWRSLVPRGAVASPTRRGGGSAALVWRGGHAVLPPHGAVVRCGLGVRVLAAMPRSAVLAQRGGGLALRRLGGAVRRTARPSLDTVWLRWWRGLITRDVVWALVTRCGPRAAWQRRMQHGGGATEEPRGAVTTRPGAGPTRRESVPRGARGVLTRHGGGGGVRRWPGAGAAWARAAWC